MSSSSAAAAAAPGATPADALRRNRILSSKLYFDVPGSKAPLVYSAAYDIAFLGIEKMHPFDSSKWGRICKFLTKEGHLEKSRVVEPLEASKEDLLVVHTESYLNSLKSSFRVAAIVEVPPLTLMPNWLVQQKLLYPFRKQERSVGKVEETFLGSLFRGKIKGKETLALSSFFYSCAEERGKSCCSCS